MPYRFYCIKSLISTCGVNSDVLSVVCRIQLMQQEADCTAKAQKNGSESELGLG